MSKLAEAACGLIMLLGLSAQPAAAIVYAGHDYRVTSGASDWLTAETEAISMGGHLVSINDADEQAFVRDFVLVGSLENVPVWLGLHDADTEGTFTWSDGSSLTFTNWKNGEPNNYGAGEDYVAMNWEYARATGPKGTWNDTPLGGSSGFGGLTDGPYYGIVEIVLAPSAVPEPSLQQALEVVSCFAL